MLRAAVLQSTFCDLHYFRPHSQSCSTSVHLLRAAVLQSTYSELQYFRPHTQSCCSTSVHNCIASAARRSTYSELKYFSSHTQSCCTSSYTQSCPDYPTTQLTFWVMSATGHTLLNRNDVECQVTYMWHILSKLSHYYLTTIWLLSHYPCRMFEWWVPPAVLYCPSLYDRGRSGATGTPVLHSTALYSTAILHSTVLIVYQCVTLYCTI